MPAPMPTTLDVDQQRDHLQKEEAFLDLILHLLNNSQHAQQGDLNRPLFGETLVASVEEIQEQLAGLQCQRLKINRLPSQRWSAETLSERNQLRQKAARIAGATRASIRSLICRREEIAALFTKIGLPQTSRRYNAWGHELIEAPLPAVETRS